MNPLIFCSLVQFLGSFLSWSFTCMNKFLPWTDCTHIGVYQLTTLCSIFFMPNTWQMKRSYQDFLNLRIVSISCPACLESTRVPFKPLFFIVSRISSVMESAVFTNELKIGYKRQFYVICQAVKIINSVSSYSFRKEFLCKIISHQEQIKLTIDKLKSSIFLEFCVKLNYRREICSTFS